MHITFLIGNGFDRNLGLATSYADFVKYYKETSGGTEILKQFREHIKENEELWSAAEIEMGQYTREFEAGQGAAFSDCHNDFCEHLAEYLKQQEKRVDYDYVANKIEQAFSNLNFLTSPFPTQERETINQVYSAAKSENTFFNFINFNYTHTLDQCISKVKEKQAGLGSHRHGTTTHIHVIGDVRHIHGTVEGQMVFGVNDKSQIANPDIFSCEYGDLYENSVIKIQTNRSYAENTDANTKAILDKSQILYIYGMSIGETDKLWWERVCAWLHASSNRHLIVYRYNMPSRGLTEVRYMIEERKARKEISQFAKLDDKQKSIIENRIHITGSNIFEAIKDVADKTKSSDEVPSDVAREDSDLIHKRRSSELTVVGSGAK